MIAGQCSLASASTAGCIKLGAVMSVHVCSITSYLAATHHKPAFSCLTARSLLWSRYRQANKAKISAKTAE